MKGTGSCCYTSTEETTLPVIMVSPPKLTYKIVILGDANSGKTTLIHRLIWGTFLQDSAPTNGTGYNDYYIQIQDRRVHCQVWDTAGQERFNSLIPTYIRGTDLCLIALSLDKSAEENDKSLQTWTERLRDVTEGSLVIVVGTKSDLENTSVPTYIKVSTSSVLGDGITELKEEIASSISSLL